MQVSTFSVEIFTLSAINFTLQSHPLKYWTTFDCVRSGSRALVLKSCQSSPALERLFSICANLDSSENQVTLGLTIFRYIYKIIPAYIEQVYRIFSWRPCWRAETIKQFCMKIYLISKGRDNVLFLPSNIAAMTSHENAPLKTKRY